MGWFWLLLAGLMEVGWPVGMKYAWVDDKLRLAPAGFAVFCLTASMGFLLLAQRSIPIGTAYAVWTGIGSVGAFVVGVWLFGEPATAARWTCIALIVAGIVGLKVADAGHANVG